MKRFRIRSLVVLGVAVVAVLLYTIRPGPSNVGSGQPDQFTVGTAILVVGYLVFPVLALIAAVLLLVAMLLVVAQLVESRRDGGRRTVSRDEAGRG